MIDIAGIRLSNATLLFGTPGLRADIPVLEAEDGCGGPTAVRQLGREDVEQLRDACEAWLRGEVLR